MEEETTQDRASPAGCPSQGELAAFNRGRRWNAPAKRWTPQAIEQKFAQLAAAPYREYSSYRCGPWLQDSPAPPKNGHTWWTRYKPGK